MARTGHSTNLTSGRHRARQPQSQKLMDKEILELKNYLPEWTAAKRSEKQGIFTAIARAARLFAPKVDQKQWKKRKQMYKTWLFNNKKKKERKAGHDQVWEEMDAQDGGLPAEMRRGAEED
ncbi:hypothetical protein EV702DRAFT_1203316 [Suillus placidus]|uniref:Uncharacterized protein n=1 Tax=Suillus placidus TaxID=48579 RepID=A0A9P6ZJ35_9AGAM|nr:hypothetical protein EV702DRAFT_1203316 [Suillus placidus]